MLRFLCSGEDKPPTAGQNQGIDKDIPAPHFTLQELVDTMQIMIFRKKQLGFCNAGSGAPHIVLAWSSFGFWSR